MSAPLSPTVSIPGWWAVLGFGVSQAVTVNRGLALTILRAINLNKTITVNRTADVGITAYIGVSRNVAAAGVLGLNVIQMMAAARSVTDTAAATVVKIRTLDSSQSVTVTATATVDFNPFFPYTFPFNLIDTVYPYKFKSVEGQLPDTLPTVFGVP